jgi:glycosyltransferase involved in cell wall biosynthesis
VDREIGPSTDCSARSADVNRFLCLPPILRLHVGERTVVSGVGAHVTVLRSSKAFLPEVAAYRTALEQAGFAVAVLDAAGFDPTAAHTDLVYRFGGVLRPLSRSVPEVHEYVSASVGRGAWAKDLLKSLADGRPAGRVFLNDYVRSRFHFPRSAPSILREMGVDPAFLAVRDTVEQRFDLVYAGVLSERPGVVDTLLALAGQGWHIGVAGRADERDTARLGSAASITFVGVLPAAEVPAFVAAGRAGLNLMPLVVPYIHQTSTKVLEYLVAGLPVVSPDYPWISGHAARLGYSVVPLDALLAGARPPLPPPIDAATAAELLWPTVLAEAGFVEFVAACVAAGAGGGR